MVPNEGYIVLILTKEEASALCERLGSNSRAADLKVGLTVEQTTHCFNVYDRLSDILEGE